MPTKSMDMVFTISLELWHILYTEKSYLHFRPKSNKIMVSNPTIIIYNN